jgi:hypothetical protein
VIYSWVGGSESATQTGGTVSVLGSDDEVNVASSTINGTYYVIKVASKKASVATSHTQIALNSTLQEGDQIRISGFQNKNASDKVVTTYLKFLDGTTDKGDISDSNNWGNMYNDAQYATINEPETKTFNVTSALAGSNTIYITRNSSGTNLWISKIEIVRPASKAATPTVTLGDYNTTTSKYAVTLSCATDGATIHYSTDNKASYTDYSVALALAPGTTLDAYATKTSMDDSDAMEQYTVPAAPTEWVVTYENAEGATGIVPSEDHVTIGENYMLPTNITMYKEGYTLTGWNDGTTTHAVGASYTPDGNKTLTAVYTANTVSLADRNGAVTVKWGPFNQNLRIPDIHFEGGTGFVVTQATVNGQKIDVKLPIDATNGKFKNQAENAWTQVGVGTVFTIPAADGATITYKQYDAGAVTTPEESATGDTYELTAAGTAGQLYYEYIQVELPALPLKNVANFKFTAKSDWNNSNHQTVGKIKATFSNNAENSYVKYAKGNTLTLEVTGEYVITKVELGYVSNNYSPAENTITTEVGTMNAAGTLWTGCADGLVITNSATGSNDTRVNMLKVTYVPSVPIAITCEGGYASYSCDKALDFTGSNAKAYIIKATSESSATLTEVTKVPANTGIIVAGTKGETVNVLTTDGATDDVTGNLLKGTVNTPVAVDADKAYGLSKTDGKFHLLNAGTIPANKAYLLASEVFQASGAAVLDLDFGETTGINMVNGSEFMVNGSDFYNLNGQRVAQPTKGLYIVNGRKVIIK